jgi:hypothetical protein
MSRLCNACAPHPAAAGAPLERYMASPLQRRSFLRNRRRVRERRAALAHALDKYYVRIVETVKREMPVNTPDRSLPRE